MEWISLIFTVLTSIFLLVFGAMVVWRGTTLIYNFYPKTLTTPKPGKNDNTNPAVSALSNALSVQNQALTQIQTQKNILNSQRTASNQGPTDADNSASEDIREQEKLTLNSINELISSVVSLLGAHFGPAALLILSGMVIMGSGIWLMHTTFSA